MSNLFEVVNLDLQCWIAKMEQWLQLVASALLGGVATLVGDRIRQRWSRPILAVSFSDGPDCITRTPVNSRSMAGEQRPSEGIWVRVKVRNRGNSAAKNCRVFMTSFRIESADETRIILENQDAVQLQWELLAGEHVIDLPQSINQFVDICHTIKDRPNDLNPCTTVQPLRLMQLWQRTGRFRITVTVTADDATPASATAMFSWGGRWDTITVD